MNNKHTEQSSEGDQSPVINTEGDISFHYHADTGDEAGSNSNGLFNNSSIIHRILNFLKHYKEAFAVLFALIVSISV